METIYLKTFIDVVKTGSFTQTADNLCVTQSAVSRRVQFMENQYGCSLLDRSGPLLKPTPEGQLILEKASKILEIEQDLKLELSQFGSKNSLSFVSTPTFGTIHLPPILSSFIRTQPKATNLRFVMDLPDGILQNLRRGLFEIAVIEHCQGYDVGDFETIALPPDEMVFAAATDLGLPSQQPSLDELFRYPLLSRNPDCCSRILLESNLKKTGHRIEEFSQIIEMDDLDRLITPLLQGEGIAFISNDQIKPFVENGQLQEFRLPAFIHQRKRTLVLPAHSTNCSLTRQFAELIVAHFENE